VLALGDVLRDTALRARLGAGARQTSHLFTWDHAQESFAVVLREVLAGRRIESQDPDEERGPRRPGD
jgi:hypothetical protein